MTCHREALLLIYTALLILVAVTPTASAYSLLPSDHAPSLFTLDGLPAPTSTPAGSPAAGAVPGRPASDPVIEGRGTDWTGVWIDTGILLGGQVAAVGIIYLMPESVSGWSNEQKNESFKKYGNNVGHPHTDSDKFYINYILHPYWGAAYYTRARERGMDEGPSFIYSAVISAIYEFGVECFFEKPSIQDLIVTPVAGSLLGAYVFEPLRATIRAKQELAWYDEAMLVATDPVGVLSSGVEKLTGRKATLKVDYTPQQLQKYYANSDMSRRGQTFGITLQFPMN